MDCREGALRCLDLFMEEFASFSSCGSYLGADCTAEVAAPSWAQ